MWGNISGRDAPCREVKRHGKVGVPLKPAQHAFAGFLASKFNGPLLDLKTAAVSNDRRLAFIASADRACVLRCTVILGGLSCAVERIGIVEQAAVRVEKIQVSLMECIGSLQVL
ncbi:hypothetical protein D3C87_1037680 [compost metagenome]